ncbi:MAG: hypothetical protein IPO31_20895 [Candidatus Obscuribacter sp.]|nr:hypothetical protein [Candidatus Obscuribacter sp.]
MTKLKIEAEAMLKIKIAAVILVVIAFVSDVALCEKKGEHFVRANAILLKAAMTSMAMTGRLLMRSALMIAGGVNEALCCWGLVVLPLSGRQ